MTRIVATPCVKVCVMESASGLCAGCGRTLDEIACWGSMSAAEQARLMDILPQRLEARTKSKSQETSYSFSR
jgi:predicted Fe-S protein YdhL (DUF1289 family)